MSRVGGWNENLPCETLAAPTRAYDGPGQILPNFYSSGTRDFHAVMYLLWQPPQLTGTGTASIPVPIGSQDWIIARGRTRNSAYPTGQNWTSPVWNLLGEYGAPVDYVTSAPANPPYGYPTWNGLATAAPVAGCPKDTTQADEAQQEEE